MLLGRDVALCYGAWSHFYVMPHDTLYAAIYAFKTIEYCII